MRHPFNRSNSLFHYLRYATHENEVFELVHDTFLSLSYHDYLDSEYFEDNWICRILNNVTYASSACQLNNIDVDHALDVLFNYLMIAELDHLQQDLTPIRNYLKIKYYLRGKEKGVISRISNSNLDDDYIHSHHQEIERIRIN